MHIEPGQDQAAQLGCGSQLGLDYRQAFPVSEFVLLRVSVGFAKLLLHEMLCQEYNLIRTGPLL